MDIPRQRPIVLRSGSPLRSVASLTLLTAGVAFAGALCGSGDYRNAAVVIAMSSAAAFLIIASVRIETVLLTWFATTPLASFYLRYPLDRSIITYNRGVFVLLLVVLLLEARPTTTGTASHTGSESRTIPAELSLSKFEVAWTFLSVLALASALAQSNNVAYAARIAIDTFWLPVIAFYFARRYFDLRTGGTLLLMGCVAVALFLFATGVFELATGIDLFQYKGAELVREGERRVNGPFAADSSFAIICLMLFLFLQAAPELIRARFDRAGKFLYRCAIVAAALGALLSLFRVVAFALVVCWIAQWWLTNPDRSSVKHIGLRRFLPLGALIAVLLLVVGGFLARVTPSISGGRLSDPRSAFGRLATWQAAAEIALDNPVFGVGLTNYFDYYDASHYYSGISPEEVLETKAAMSPHSNVLWIASELGFCGLALYIAANVYLFFMGLRAVRRAEDRQQRIAASCFLALVVGYWIPGFTLASGYYSDLNLYFLFLLGALSTRFSGMSAMSGAPPTTVEFRV